MQNTELILKKATELKDPLSFLTDIDAITSLPESLEKFEVVLVGKKSENYKEGDFILCRKDIVKTIPHQDFEGVFVLFNEMGAFSKCNK